MFEIQTGALFIYCFISKRWHFIPRFIFKNDIFTCYISPLLCSLSILPVANSQFFTSTPIIVSAPATRIKTRFSIQRKAAFSGQCQHLRRPQIPRPHSLNRQRSSKSSHSKNMLLPHHQNLNLPLHHGT